MLERFRKAKQREISMLEKLASENRLPTPYQGTRASFIETLKSKAPYPVIAEYKRASPSKGDINLDVTPKKVAEAYLKAGAGAISVLTEEDYFKGSLAYLDEIYPTGLPLLRKDFILHPLQVIQTASTPASAMLLIVRMLDDTMLDTLLKSCRAHHITPVTEVFDSADLVRAKKFNAEVIQVNNRDLDKLTTDLSISEKLITQKEAHEFWITASGIANHDQLSSLIQRGFDAALIGSSIMEQGDPGEGLFKILHGKNSHA